MKPLTQSEQTEAVTQNIILSHGDMEQSHGSNHPDEDISHDTTGQVMAVCRNRPIPEERRHCPGQRTCDSRQMHESGESLVSPVGGELVEQVSNQDHLGAPEVVAGPEEDPGKDEEVVQDEVGRDVGSGSDDRDILGEQVPDVAELREKEQNPVRGVSGYSECSVQRYIAVVEGSIWYGVGRGKNPPVDTGDSCILTERRLVLIRLLPDLLALLHIIWRVDGVVDAHDDDQRPGEGHENAIRIQRLSTMRLAPSKGIKASHFDQSRERW